MLVGVTNIQRPPACEFAQKTRLYSSRRGVSVLRASLGQQAPRGSSGSAASRIDSTGVLGSQRRRVAAAVADAPPVAKEDKGYLLELETQKDILQMAYLAHIDPALDSLEVEEDIEELEDIVVDEEIGHVEEVVRRVSERRRSSIGASTSNALESGGATAFDNVRVPSTRRARKQATRAESESASKESVPFEETFASIGAEEDSHLFGGDELAQDAAFMAQLRTFLRNTRRAKRTSKRPAILSGRVVSTSTVASFLSGLGNTPILGGRHEQRLSRVIARGNNVKASAAALARSTGRMPSLADVAADAGLSSAQDAARAVVLADIARGLMVDFNMRMVVSIAKRYLNNGVEFSDLIPEGIIGLRRAIERFDASKGFRFSTYSHWWIRQSITRAISDQSRDVRLPTHVVEFLMRMNKTKTALRDAQPGRSTPPTHAEVAAAMGVPLHRLMATLRAARPPRTPEDMSAPSSSGHSSNVKALGVDIDSSDAWCDEDEPPTDFIAEGERAEFLRETVTLMLSTLAVRDRNVLKLRYGLHPTESIDTLLAEHGESLPEIDGDDIDQDLVMGLGLLAVGKKYHLSRERIRQIENKALEHLRKEWRKNMVHDVKEGKQLSQSARDALHNAIANAKY